MIAKFRKTKKGSWQNIFFAVFLGLLILIVVGFLFFANWQMGQRRRELNSQIEALQKEIQALEEKHQTLEVDLSQSAEESYLEKEARERFNLKKPGEEVVTILPFKEEIQAEKERETVWWNPLTW